MTSIDLNNIENEYNNAIQLFHENKHIECESKLKYVLKYIPDNSDVLNFYGRLKQFQGDFKTSIELLEKAVSFNKNNHMAHYNLGLAYCVLKNLDKTKFHFLQYQELNNDDNKLKYFCNLYISKLHFDELDIEDTKEFYRRTKIPLFQKLSSLLIPRIYHSNQHIEDSRKEYYDTLLKIYNDCDDMIINTKELFSEYLQFIYCYGFPLSYQGKNNKEILQLQCKLYRKIFPVLNYESPYLNEIKTRPKTKIKIGFISTNFFNQSVSRDRMGIIRNLPRELFDVVVFFYFKPTDDLGNFIWNSDNTNIVLPDSSIFERRNTIEQQKLDIIIYCDIGMAPDTYFLSYSKLAPIQCNTWGHSDTSGIDTIDYYLSSKYYELTEGAENNYSEKLVLLDSLCTFYYKIIQSPDLSTKNYFGFSNNVNIYLSSQVLFKLNPNFDKVVNQILENDPNGICIFIKMNLGSYIQDILINRMEKTLGSNMTRLHLVEWQKCERDFYKLLSIADVIIDPYPFGGCNTSFSAFSMGIPIVTRPSDQINGRFTHGLYQKMNIHDLVAHSDEEYVKLANKCAMNKEFRKSISTKILNNIDKIFNEVDSINTWINFCVNAVNNQLGATNPIHITYSENNQNTDLSVNNQNSDLSVNNQNTDLSVNNQNSDLIPKIIHFIHFGYTEFTFVHFYAIKTAYINNPTYTINLYYHKEPENNKWWIYAQEFITNMIITEPPQKIFNHELKHFAHKADVLRMQKLIEHGGIYLDIDVWTNKSYDDLLSSNKSCIMGYQAKNTNMEGLCNAVILAKPQSEFIKMWIQQYVNFNNQEWDNHSVFLPKLLSEKYPELIDIKSQSSFFPVSWWDFDVLFKTSSENNKLLDNSYCIHLWESHLQEKLLNKLTPSYFSIYNTPFSHIFSKYIQHNNKSMIFIIQDNNINYIQKSILYINQFLEQGYSVYIKLTSKLINHDSILENIDDSYILLNTISNKNYNISDINHIFLFTDSSLYYLKNEINQNQNISTSALFNHSITNTENLNNIQNFITPYKTSIDFIQKTYSINSIYLPYPLSNITNTIDIFSEKSKPNWNLSNNEIFNGFILHENIFISELSHQNIYIEHNNCLPLNNVKTDKFIFYSFISQFNENNLTNLIKCYIQFYKNNNNDNILLYIYSNNNSNFDNEILPFIFKLRDWGLQKPILFNFNNLSIKNISYIHEKANCYISLINDDFSIFNSILAAKNNNHVITKNNDYLKEYISNITFINNFEEKSYDIIASHMSSVYNIDSANSNTYIQNYIYNDLNSIFINTTNKQEILILGKLSTFKNRMDKLYYNLLENISNNSKFDIKFIDSKKCLINQPLSFYINKYCNTKNPIIYNIVYTDKSEQIISDLSESKLTKIYEIEDCYEIDNLIFNINHFKYDYVIYRYNCEQMDYIKSKSPDTKFIHFPHYIDNNMFNTNFNEDKPIDILLYGNISNFYPFRNRLFNLIIESKLNYYYLEHPGYDEHQITNNKKTIQKDLSNLINKSKITISTCSAFNYFVKKYLEISLSGSLIAGNFPLTENNLYNDCMIHLNETMSDNEIIEKLQYYLSISADDYNKMITKSHEITTNHFTYKQAILYFDHIIDSINSIDNNNQNENQNQNELSDIAVYDNYKYKCNCESFKWHINNGLSQPYPRELKIITNYLKSNPTKNNLYIDIGGHFGTTCIPYSKLFKNIHVFEPNKENFDLLNFNIKINSIKNIYSHNYGIYNKTTNAICERHDNNSGSIVMKEVDKPTSDSIQMLALDSIQFNDKVDFIKIDTEGSELYVLQGAKSIIDNHKPIIQVETNHCSQKFFNYDKNEIYDFMYSMNYKILDDDGNDPIFYYDSDLKSSNILI